jgi:hypothetical protein
VLTMLDHKTQHLLVARRVCLRGTMLSRASTQMCVWCRQRVHTQDHVDSEDLGSLMKQNLAVRCQMYSDEALGNVNLAMVKAASDVGAAAKFCGSGGAVLVCCPGGEDMLVKLIGARVPAGN